MKGFRVSFLAAFFSIATLVSSNVSAYVIGPTTPGKWGSPTIGTGATITWGYMDTGVDCSLEFAGCSITSFADFMPAGFDAAVNAAFDAWSAVANITFVEVTDGGEAFNATGPADIRLGGHAFDGAGGVLAHGYYPPNNGNGAAGDIHFDIAELWKVGFGGAGFDIFQVMAHELGHALGLDHTAVANSLMNPFYTEAFSGPQADDIAGMQYLYGKATVDADEPLTLSLLLMGLAATFVQRRRQGTA